MAGPTFAAPPGWSINPIIARPNAGMMESARFSLEAFDTNNAATFTDWQGLGCGST